MIRLHEPVNRSCTIFKQSNKVINKVLHESEPRLCFQAKQRNPCFVVGDTAVFFSQAENSKGIKPLNSENLIK